MFHLEMSYLTHSHFSTTIIPGILPLFRARFRIFWWILYFEFSSARDLNLFFPSFAQGFGFFDKLILCPSVRARFGVFLKNNTSILFRLRFEVDLWYFYPLPPEVLDFFTNWFSTPLSARGLEFFWKMTLLSSFAWGSKLISDTSILFRLRFLDF